MTQQFGEGGGRGGKLCPAGRHTMDPNWTTCPYCKGAQAQGPTGQEPPDDQGKKMRKKTVFGEIDEKENKRRVTRMDEPIGNPPEEARERAPVSSGSTESSRKIVGVLITYSRKSGGEIFPIREGKTYIGRDVNKYQELCDILFPDDTKMSSEHAAIIYRPNRYQIIDQQSVNGTFVNDKDVEQAELQNYDEIKLGRTLFTFIKTERPSEEEPLRQEVPREEPERHHKKDIPLK